ncbi:MAG: hypothetical protein DELT_02489 [Desulfovibrio sp.]
MFAHSLVPQWLKQHCTIALAPVIICAMAINFRKKGDDLKRAPLTQFVIHAYFLYMAEKIELTQLFFI